MSYKVNGREYDFDSCTNQRIKDKFVDRQINVCVTSITEFIIKVTSEGMPYMDIENEAPFTYNDIENQYVDNTDELEELNDKLEELESQKDELEEKLDELESELENTREEFEDEPQRVELRDDISSIEKEIQTINTSLDVLSLDIEELEDKISDLESEDGDFKEVYEWWDVSGWLCDKLQGYGEVVIPHMGYWGRQTTGQSISLDYVISKICYNMEILEGQERSWEEYVK